MANGILSLIQPNGSDKFNLRAESVFYFKPSTDTTGNPGSGFVGIDETNEHALVFQHDNIVSVNPGMIIAFECPINWDYKNVIIKNGSTLLSTTQLAITHSVDNRNGCLAFEKGEFYIMVLDYNNNFKIINTHLVESVSHNSKRPVTAKAVYDFVTEKLANRWKYIVSNSIATTPNQTTYDGANGTLTPSADTEYIIYLVPHTHEAGKDIYDEWITVKNGSTYSWEKIGNTDIDIDFDGIISSINPHTFTPSGTVSQPTFTGNKVTTDSKGAHTHSVTATGSVSSTFSGTQATLSGTTEGHQHTIGAKGLTVKGSVTAAGTVSQPTFTGTAATIESTNPEDIESTSNSHSHSIAASDISVSGKYTPEGDISTPTITVTPSDTVYSMTGVGSASSYSVSNEVLILTPSTVPTRSSVTFTGSSTTPTFTGKQGTITSKNSSPVSISGGAHSHKLEAQKIKVSGEYTPAGSVSKPTFTGSTVTVTSTNETDVLTSKVTDNVAINYTPAGTVTSTFTGTPATTDSKGSHTHDVTATGTVSQPTFTGTSVTLEHEEER